jgi:hypothetical protein
MPNPDHDAIREQISAWLSERQGATPLPTATADIDQMYEPFTQRRLSLGPNRTTGMRMSENIEDVRGQTPPNMLQGFVHDLVTGFTQNNWCPHPDGPHYLPGSQPWERSRISDAPDSCVRWESPLIHSNLARQAGGDDIRVERLPQPSLWEQMFGAPADFTKALTKPRWPS